MADNFKFAQLQSYSLNGSGAVSGATSITLKSMTDIDGNALSMSGSFGTKGFGTLEPGNGNLEEQISFTGLVNNANGTVTLTGVSNVTFVSPYTETSGLSKTHAGSTPFVISNTSGFYNKLTAKDDDETITGLWDFPSGSNNPTIGNGSYVAPTANTQVATKKYVDDVAIAGAPDATTSVKGIVQIPTQAQVDAKTATGSTGASLTPTPDLLRSTLLSDYVVDTGVADAYVITPSPAISAYAAGQRFSFKVAHTNTTSSTINVNSKGLVTIKKGSGATNLSAGDLIAGQVVEIEYDGTNFQMMSPVANTLPTPTSGAINEFITTTDGSTFTFGRPFDYQVYTTTGANTWTKPSNLSGNEMVFVQLWGGGGAGGGATANGTGGGGGGGAYVQGYFRASDLGSTVTVTIATGGTGSTGSGTVGGNTTFGSLLTAYGGGGGATGTSQNGGGGGGGGALGVGQSVTSTSDGTGGSPGAATGAADGWGGAGGGVSPAAGYGGGGGGNGGVNPGGASLYGGGGGASGGAVSGGVSVFAGAGGAGTTDATGGAGTAPAGGGGGVTRTSGSRTGGGGARGEARVWTFY